MEIKEKKEIEQLIANSTSILITTRGNPGFDDVATCLAWYESLTKAKKERVDVVMQLAEDSKNRFKFLPGFTKIQDSIQAADYFVIQIDASKTKVKELSYDMRGTNLEVRVKPKDGKFKPSDVSFSETSFTYDLIIVIGASDLASIGPAFEQNRDLFFNAPIINIDRFSSNVRFGQINAIYLTTTSLAEISYELLRDSMNKEIATALLTGIISATNSFQTPQVTPDTLHLASELIVAGASREDIVDRLYRNKDMNKLKIWGRVLSHMQQVNTHIVYSHLQKEEITANDIDLQGLVDELVLASPEAHIVLFFYQSDEDKTEVFAYARENYDLPILLQKFNPLGRGRKVRFVINKDTAQTELEVLAHVREQIKLTQH